MVAQAAVVPFSQIIRSLKARKLPSMERILDYLGGFRQRTMAARILHELDPEEFKKAATLKPDPDEWIEDPIVNACVNAINNLAPLDMDAMANRFEDGRQIDELYPASCGYPMGWDEWDELIQSTDDWNESMALYIFVTAMRMGETGTLVNANEHFDWELEFQDEIVIQDPDWDKLFELLDQNGMGCFKNAINVCLYGTDNPYFDFNPWDESTIYALPEFSREGVQKLMEYWEDAQPISRDLTRAVARFCSDPALPGLLWSLYSKASEEPKKQPQTLAELWEGEGEAEQVVDPFWGPIGADLSEDEEEDNDENND